MEFENGAVKHIQEYVTDKIKSRGFQDESLEERLLLLTEEVGELVKACRKVNGMFEDQAKMNEYKVGEELADVINMVFAVGISLGLDIEKEFIEKNKIVDQRVYKRSTN